MLSVFQSNRIETLADALAETMRMPIAAPLQPETVVLQSGALSRWLGFALAERLGVATNVQWQFPARYIWTLFAAVLPQVSQRSPFEPQLLHWRFMRLLQSEASLRAQPRLAHYLQGDDARRCDELVRRLTQTFDRYLVQRPDWIAAWHEGRTLDLGTDENWQARLWQLTAADVAEAHPREAFCAAIDADPEARARLPQRLHLFALDALPAMYLDVFARIAAHVDVRVYALNPCREYWGDIVKRRTWMRQQAEGIAEAAHYEVGNSLLASMGHHGRAFFDALSALPAQLDEHYEPPQGDSLLATLQRDVLELRERGDASDDARTLTLATDDVSLQVHICHSAMREVEVLHDRLLDAFARDAQLRPGDVLVLVPRIERYAPAIDAVFSTAPAAQRMAFTIADLPPTRSGDLLGAFCALLRLHEGRMEAEAVLAWLECAPLAARFGIAPGDLPQLRQWVRDAGIRWGHDAEARAALDLPATAEHSWAAGFDRLLLGYAMPGEARVRYDGVLPCDDVEGAASRLLGSLKSLVDTLAAVREALREPRTLAQWARWAERLLRQCFEIGEDDERAAQTIRSAAAALVEDGQRADYRGVLPVEVWRVRLEALLQPAVHANAFLNGGVTFAALRATRPVPARFIAVLGLNDGDLPHNAPLPGFDLAVAHPRAGDRDARDEDRYALLAALLSARAQLHLSYTGRSVRDNSVLAPSPLLAELLDVVRRGFHAPDGGDAAAHICVAHPLQAFSHRYFDGSDARLYSYAADHAAAGRAAADARGVAPFVAAPLAPSAAMENIELTTLARFVRNPARHFLQARLGMRLGEREETLDDHEPFALDNLARYGLRQTVLQHLLAGCGAAESLALTRAGGLLPHGSSGDALHARAVEKMRPLAAAHAAAGALHTEAIDLRCGAWRLVGSVAGVAAGERLALRAGRLRQEYVLQYWVEHLALNAAGVALPSVAHGVDAQLRFAVVPDALGVLEDLLDLLEQGACAPLPFFPESSWAFAGAAAKGKDEIDCLEAARSAWQGAWNARGEVDDEWIALAFRDRDALAEPRFIELAQAVYAPLREAQCDD